MKLVLALNDSVTLVDFDMVVLYVPFSLYVGAIICFVFIYLFMILPNVPLSIEFALWETIYKQYTYLFSVCEG